MKSLLLSVLKCHLLLALCILFAMPAIVNSKSIESRVAFFVEHEGGMQAVNTRTGETHPIDVGMMNIGDLAYSHKRNTLVFEGSKRHGEPRAIYLYELGSKRNKRLYNPTSYKDTIYRPQFHPSGDFLYALNYTTGIFQYSFASEEWKKIQVENTKEVNFQGVSISRSGNKVALSPSMFKGFLIGELDNNRIRITNTILVDFNSCISPRWIGDNTIVFAGRKTKGKQYLWKVSLDTGVAEQLTKEPLGTRDFLDVSIDESTIVFTATDSSYEWRLWTIDTNGEELKPLTKTGLGHLSPVWIQ